MVRNLFAKQAVTERCAGSSPAFSAFGAMAKWLLNFFEIAGWFESPLLRTDLYSGYNGKGHTAQCPTAVGCKILR